MFSLFKPAIFSFPLSSFSFISATSLAHKSTEPTLWHPPLSMLSCSCGRSFNSEPALTQHRADKFRLGGASTACQMSIKSSPQARRSSRQTSGWLLKDVKNPEAIRTIDHSTLVPSTAAVSSAKAAELVGSYNWQNCNNVEYKIPGELLTPIALFNHAHSS